MPAFTVKASIATFGGRLLKLSHPSTSTGTDMAVSIYLPPAALSGSQVPVLIYLSGLTCTPDNCSEKGGFFGPLAEKGIAMVLPDTSPRGLNIPGDSDSWDFGVAASFYIDAEREPWKGHYKMETYLTEELPKLLFHAGEEVVPYENAPALKLSDVLDGSRVSITGHSMGGHGALTLYLRHPELFKSCSAFSAICNPSACPWGKKAFTGYLSEDGSGWAEHDATELIKSKGFAGGDLKLLIDVGTADGFYKAGQLLPENLEKAVAEKGLKGLTLRYHDGYDHSYYFISTFSRDHVEHAAKYLL